MIVNKNMNKYKSKNAFTLVELLAVLIILAVILVIVIPKMLNIIVDVRKSTLESTAKLVALSAEKRNLENDVFGVEKTLTCEDIVKINDLDYESCKVKYVDNKFNVTIVGSGKFEGMYICNGTKTDSKVVDYCINEDVLVSFELNGGSINKDKNGIYAEGTIIELEEPTKTDSEFLGWKIVKGNSILENNKLSIGNKDTIVYAMWENLSLLNVDLSGGMTVQKLNSSYKSGTNFVLEEPIKTGYTFSHWSTLSGNSILSGNNFTMGSVDSSILANYIPNNYTIEFKLNGGKFNESPLSIATYDSIIKIEKPTKIGYKFTGWTFSGIDNESARYGDSLNDVSQVLTDVVLGEYFLNLNSNMNGSVVMTANWEFVPDIVVYEHKDAYVFDGTNYIDTGISLFSEEYDDVNFEVSFSILDVNAEQEKNAALFNSLNEADENYPGILFRVVNTTEYFEVLGNNKVNNYLQRAKSFEFTEVTNVKIVRINNITYYSINDGDYYELQDFSTFSEYFDVPVTFGASLDENGQPFRYFKGTLSNMKIKFLSENASVDAYSLKYYTKDSTSFDGTNYINTNVYLFDEVNAKKDFEISFTLASFADTQEEYATILNSIDESNKDYPGFLFRFKKVTSTTTITQVELVSNAADKINTPFDAKTVTSVTLTRKNNKLYYTIGENKNVEVLDYSDFTEYFSVPITIGSSMDEEGNAYRYFKGNISNIEIMVREDINKKN